LYRADDEILLGFKNIRFADQSPPLIHLRQATYGGLFDRLVHDFDDRWDGAVPVVSSDVRQRRIPVGWTNAVTYNRTNMGDKVR
jgi:hypothetical protein